MTRTESPEGCAKTLLNCIQLIGNLAVLPRPFLPFSSDRVIGWLGLQKTWKPQRVTGGFQLPETEPLFRRVELPEA